MERPLMEVHGVDENGNGPTIITSEEGIEEAKKQLEGWGLSGITVKVMGKSPDSTETNSTSQ